MNNKLAELDELHRELIEVKSSPMDYIPEYGFSSKEEIIKLIQEDIRDVEREIESNQYEYISDELEKERQKLCASLGISRYC